MYNLQSADKSKDFKGQYKVNLKIYDSVGEVSLTWKKGLREKCI